jgi:hypothetical protein
MAVEVVGKLARVTAVMVAQALTTQKLVSDPGQSRARRHQLDDRGHLGAAA